MRTIKQIIIHCAATKPKMDIGVKEIRSWHIKRGWSDIGYHYVIRLDGTIETGRSLYKAGAHVKGKNRNSIGICLIGGLNELGKAENTFNKYQFKSLDSLVSRLEKEYKGSTVHGHNEFSKKACPCFSVKDRYNPPLKFKKEGCTMKHERKETLLSLFLKLFKKG